MGYIFFRVKVDKSIMEGEYNLSKIAFSRM